MEYQILSCMTVGDLEDSVNEAIGAGWQPLGGMAMMYPDRYCQAVVRVKMTKPYTFAPSSQDAP